MTFLERQVSHCDYARELWIGKYPVFCWWGLSLDQRPQLLSMAFANVTRQLSTDGNRLVFVSGHYAKCQPRTVTWAVEGSLEKMSWTCCVR